MGRVRRAGWLLTATLMTVSVLSATASAAQHGSITGTVVESFGGAPLVDICVGALDPSDNSLQAEARTSPTGTYTLSVLPGTYLVLFEDCVFKEYLWELYDNTIFFDDADRISVTSGIATPNIDAALTFKGGRFAGPDRFATAATISAASFDPGVAAAYIAVGDNFPDALAGSAAAGFNLGPILLTLKDGIPTVTRDELARLDPVSIVILGGEGVVSSVVAAQLTTYGPVSRAAGPDRFATAAAVSATTFAPGVPVAYIAVGDNFPDALAGGAVAGLAGGPILLTTQGALPSATKGELARLSPARIVVLGGIGVVSAAVEAELAAFTAGTVTRLAGSDRFATAEAVSKDFYPSGSEVAFAAVGDNFPDALAGAAAGAFFEGPVLLTHSDSVPVPTARELTRLVPEVIIAFGGSAVVSDSTLGELLQFADPTIGIITSGPTDGFLSTVRRPVMVPPPVDMETILSR